MDKIMHYMMYYTNQHIHQRPISSYLLFAYPDITEHTERKEPPWRHKDSFLRDNISPVFLALAMTDHK